MLLNGCLTPIKRKLLCYRVPCGNAPATDTESVFRSISCQACPTRSRIHNNANKWPFYPWLRLESLFNVGLQAWRTLAAHSNQKLALLGSLLTQQCHFYACQRLRRGGQVLQLYSRLYSERSFNSVVVRFLKRLRSKRKAPFGFLLGSVAFSWEQEKITDDEMKSCLEELQFLEAKSLERPHRGSLVDTLCESKCQLEASGWKSVVVKENLSVWRRPVPDSYLHEYKVLGTFYDVPPEVFFRVQLDTEYRKQWDKLVIKLDIVDQDRDRRCQVVHWVMHYPYPMYSREYVFVRRAQIDASQHLMVLVSRATDHPACPQDDRFVRVHDYSSQMVIRPHHSFDENGFDYVLTYFDDPQAVFPAPAYNWIAYTGVPEFVEKLHRAAVALLHKQSGMTPVSSAPPTESSSASSNVQFAYA